LCRNTRTWTLRYASLGETHHVDDLAANVRRESNLELAAISARLRASDVGYVKEQAFSDYVERTWINGDFPPNLWSHYDNLGPRTTNVAEGWHSGLNSTFGVPHPSLRVFLDWLQRQQYEVQCRGIQLAAGRSPKQRRATYINLDAQLWNAKLQYSTELGKLFCYGFPSDSAWPQFRALSTHYQDRVSYLLGCK